MPRHFLTLSDLSASEYRALLRRAAELKSDWKSRRMRASYPGRTLAMIFEKSSTRTRVSFEVGIFRLGGYSIHPALFESIGHLVKRQRMKPHALYTRENRWQKRGLGNRRENNERIAARFFQRF